MGIFPCERDAAKAYDMTMLANSDSAETNYPKELYRPEDIEEAGFNATDLWRILPSSTYNGVYRTRTSKKWTAELKVAKYTQFLGEFKDEEQAARTFDIALRSTSMPRLVLLPQLNFRIDSDYFDEDTWDEQEIPKGRTSRFMGVSFHAGRGQFLAKLGRKHVGLFDSELDAAKAHDKASFAAGGLTNFPPPAA